MIQTYAFSLSLTLLNSSLPPSLTKFTCKKIKIYLKDNACSPKQNVFLQKSFVFFYSFMMFVEGVKTLLVLFFFTKTKKTSIEVLSSWKPLLLSHTCISEVGQIQPCSDCRLKIICSGVNGEEGMCLGNPPIYHGDYRWKEWMTVVWNWPQREAVGLGGGWE